MLITLAVGQATPVGPHIKQQEARKTAETALASQVGSTAKTLNDSVPPLQPEAQVITPVYPTDHVQLMQQAGISPSDYGAVDYIISHESGWNPDATEPTTGAHGLPQALPYSKTGCGWDDPVCQLQWANSYAISRYGGWWAAQAYWAANYNW